MLIAAWVVLIHVMINYDQCLKQCDQARGHSFSLYIIWTNPRPENTCNMFTFFPVVLDVIGFNYKSVSLCNFVSESEFY